MGRALLPAIVGHRGAAAGAPENTLEYLRLAADQGAAMVEFDVKLTTKEITAMRSVALVKKILTLKGIASV